MPLALIVHGGAWNLPDNLVEPSKIGCERALEEAWRGLEQGASAVEAVERAVVVLEDDPIFDAGIGSHLNRDGRVQLDAILMEGRTLKSGAVAGVERIKNPIRLARAVLERSEHMFLVGAGAEQFATEAGLELCDPQELVVTREVGLWQECRRAPGMAELHFNGTVGAVAMDANGNLAAATSTGGTLCKFPGRVGDSALIGCGCYADNEAGAISSTGWGEAIMKVVMAKAAADWMGAGDSAEAAAAKAVEMLKKRTDGSGGLIAIDKSGRIGFAFNTPRMAYAWRTAEGSSARI